MQRSQRTGLLTWVTRRLSTSGRCGRPGRRGWRSAGCGCRGWRSRGPAGRARRRPGACARCGRRRRRSAGSGGPSRAASSASLASCSMVPAATIWPAPLSLAGVRPCSASLASTSSRSPPRTAVMPVGVAAEAVAIALPRSRTNTIACSAVITPAPAAAAISPTLWPATAPTRPNASAGCGIERECRQQAGGDEQRLGDRGVADRLRVGLGAVVDEVECRLTADSQISRSAKSESSSQGSRNPGVWAPCPGATMTSTDPSCRVTVP